MQTAQRLGSCASDACLPARRPAATVKTRLVSPICIAHSELRISATSHIRCGQHQCASVRRSCMCMCLLACTSEASVKLWTALGAAGGAPSSFCSACACEGRGGARTRRDAVLSPASSNVRSDLHPTARYSRSVYSSRLACPTARGLSTDYNLFPVLAFALASYAAAADGPLLMVRFLGGFARRTCILMSSCSPRIRWLMASSRARRPTSSEIDKAGVYQPFIGTRHRSVCSHFAHAATRTRER